MLELGLWRLCTDISAFIYGEGDDTIIISVHVDDTNVMSSSLPCVLWLKSILHKRFGTVDDGPTSYFLGIEVVRDTKGGILELHQQKYLRKILLKFDQYLPKGK